MNIYHIIKKSAFLDITIKNFNDLNVKNTYCCIAQPDTSDKRLFYYSSVKKLCEDINNNADVVILHSLVLNPKDLLQINKKIIWCTWGYDIYTNVSLKRKLLINMDLYKFETLGFFHKPTIYMKNVLRRIRGFFGVPFNRRDYEEFCQKVSCIAPVIKDEYEIIKKQNPEYFFTLINIKYIDFEKSYSFEKKEYTPDIFIGNSATPENNHLDVLKVIDERRIESKLCMPLSYGDSDYKKYLKRKIKNRDIRILEKRLPENEYFDILSNYGNVVIGCIRQQAMGNIYNSILLGKRLFFFKDSIIYQFLKKEGFVVFTIEDDLCNSRLQEEFDSVSVMRNIEIYRKINNKDSYIETLQEQLEKVVSCK